VWEGGGFRKLLFRCWRGGERGGERYFFFFGWGGQVCRGAYGLFFVFSLKQRWGRMGGKGTKEDRARFRPRKGMGYGSGKKKEKNPTSPTITPPHGAHPALPPPQLGPAGHPKNAREPGGAPPPSGVGRGLGAKKIGEKKKREKRGGRGPTSSTKVGAFSTRPKKKRKYFSLWGKKKRHGG